LAARGVNVCLLERNSRVGGCVANFEHHCYAFEPTAGLYSGWEADGVYQRIFSELPIGPPQLTAFHHHLWCACRMVSKSPFPTIWSIFDDRLRSAFPECSQAAVAFYRLLDSIVGQSLANEPLARSMTDCSTRFRRFIDVQLQTSPRLASAQCSLQHAADVLTTPRRGMWSIRGGAQALADRHG